MFTTLMISDAFLFSLIFLFTEDTRKFLIRLGLFWIGMVILEAIVLRGELVAREAAAGYRLFSQHLPAVAVKGSDHLQ